MRDSDIRNKIQAMLRKLHKQDTRILDELSLCHGFARVDIATINGKITGYEIKSSYDTLARLPRQRDTYNLVLDEVKIVVTKNHLEEAMSLIPEWWGVGLATQNNDGVVDINWQREGKNNPSLDPMELCTFLWKEEALNILERFNSAKGVRSKNRTEIYKRLVEVLDVEQLHYEICSTLKSRTDWRVG